MEAAKACLLGSANPVVHTNALALLATLVTPDTGQLNSAVSKLVGSYSLSQVSLGAKLLNEFVCLNPFTYIFGLRYIIQNNGFRTFFVL